ncbi:unnamed protein product [Laminaria digitata]
MIRALVAANRGVVSTVVRRGLCEGSQQISNLVGFKRPNSQVLWALKSSRDFSARGRGGGIGGSRQGSRFANNEGRQRGRRNAQGTAATFGMAAIGGVMIWQGNQDAAPFTNRKRFILVNRDGEFMKGVTANQWDSVKKQYASRILPKTHQATQTVEKIGARIAEASGLEGCEWEFLVVHDESMNAFALPGGKVVVFSGLFEATPNADSMASVIGHEVGHVVANHGGEKLSKSFVKEGLLLLLFAATGFEYSNVARSLGNLIFDLPNSREMESEADYIGMQLMAKACFDPHEMPLTFGRMKALGEKRGVSKGSSYLSTHPADDERIAKQNEWMDSAVQTRSQSGCPDLAQWGLG